MLPETETWYVSENIIGNGNIAGNGNIVRIGNIIGNGNIKYLFETEINSGIGNIKYCSYRK